MPVSVLPDVVAAALLYKNNKTQFIFNQIETGGSFKRGAES